MQNDSKNEASVELQDRIKTIKNIGYFAYNKEIITCAVVFACILILIAAIFINRLIIVSAVAISLILITIAIIILYLYLNKQYFIQYNGINITVIGGFRRYRKYLINDLCYIIKNGQIEKTVAPKDLTINLLFSEMLESKTVKRVSGNQEIFLIEQTNKRNWVDAALDVGPLKYGTMTFVNGKFKNGYYVFTSKSVHIKFKSTKKDVVYSDIVSESILHLLDEQ